MKDVAREMGVRARTCPSGIPERTEGNVSEGPAEKRHIVVATKTGGLNFT